MTDRSPIAIVVAMPKEMTHLEGLLREHDARWEGTDTHGPRRFDHVTFNDMPLVLTTCWVGMVAAAAATEATIAHYTPCAILNYGCTGAHRDDLMLGDVVVGTACIAYDHGRLRPGGAFEHTPKRLRADDKTKIAAFPASAALLAVAESVAESSRWQREAWPEAHWPQDVPHRAPHVWFGPVASADRFTQDADALRALHTRHATLCEDMEAAAIAQICALHDVPFLTVKDISNNEFHTVSTFGDGGTFTTLTNELGKRAGSFLYAVLERLVAT
ncbi:MAG: 5'-methylthioadenosine/S-adenosylhomocysteine nucleosidase [Chloroflexota bacterium]|nr:5'-methylthioadenosine/S-adenosylhomocysteine nucleosidase [Chloroflexota bacterium]